MRQMKKAADEMMSQEEVDRMIGFRAPSIDSEDYDAYLVMAAIAFAAKAGVTDRDLVDRWTIDFLLGRRDRQAATFLPLVERAIGRPVQPGEPRPFDMDAIRQEQAERRQRAAAALFD